MIILIDTQNIAFRAFHTTQETDVAGEPCGAVTGTLRMISKVLSGVRAIRPEDSVFAVAVFDFGRCFWRSELYPDYKAGRPSKSNLEEFIPQMRRIEQLLPQLGASVVKSLGVEADDIISALCYEFKARTSEDIFIVTSDRDLWQLVDDRVFSVDMQTGNLVDRAVVVERFGVPPERVGEFKALVGDTSDNIKGAKGIGEKTALQIMNEFQSIPELLRGIETQTVPCATPALKKLAASIDSVRMAGQLCALPQSIDDLFTADAKTATGRVLEQVLAGEMPRFDPDILVGLDTIRLDERDLEGFII